MKKIALVIIAGLLLSIQINSYHILSKSIETENNELHISLSCCIEDDELLKEFGTIIMPGTVLIDDVENNLFKVFENKNTALKSFVSLHSNLLSVLKERYILDDLSDSNYKQYEYFFEEFFSSEDSSKYLSIFEENEYRVCACFFDIYENYDKNKTIIDLVEDINNGKREKNELIYALPYNDPFVEQNTLNNSNRLSGFNISNGISYANSYGWVQNTPSYYYFTFGDCANFCSQILEAGGISQNYTGNTGTGWWHKAVMGGSPSNPTYTHTHSLSWSTVNGFIPYFGTYNTYTSHYEFSRYVRAGSFIATDTHADGDVNHLGFVTQRGSYVSSGNYYDYKVAQHTTNYIRWTSNTNNHWEDNSVWIVVIY